MKNVIVYLAQNSAKDPNYGRDSRSVLEKSLDLLYENYNNQFKTPVLIFHEGDFLHNDQEAITKGRSEIEFHTISFNLPEFFIDGEILQRLNPNNPGKDDGTGFPLGTRHMFRFFSIQIYDYLDKLGYDWYMRMDDDSYIHTSIDYDLFEFMIKSGFEYGYRVDHKETEQMSRGFGEALLSYIKAENVEPTFLMEHFYKVSDPEPNSLLGCKYDLWGYYNNFHITRVGFWKNPDVQRFLNHMDRIGAGYKFAWTDLLIQSAAVQIFMPKKQVVKFTDWTYEHATVIGDILGCGGIFAGENYPDLPVVAEFKKKFGRSGVRTC